MEYKLGRNDLCWCGSRKKYKKCHLRADEDSARERRELEREAEDSRDPEADELVEKVMEASDPAEFESSASEFFGEDVSDYNPNPEEEDDFLDWYIREFRSAKTGLSPVQDLLQKDLSLTDRQRAMLASWGDARFSLFEVTRVEKGVSVSLKDLQDGAEYEVMDALASKQIQTWQGVLTSIRFFEGAWSFGSPTLLPRPVLLAARRYIAEHGFEARQLYRKIEEIATDWASDLEMVEMEDEPPDAWLAEYTCEDGASLAAELRKWDEAVERQDSLFQWLGGDEISIGDGEVRVQCLSALRLEVLDEVLRSLGCQTKDPV